MTSGNSTFCLVHEYAVWAGHQLGSLRTGLQSSKAPAHSWNLGWGAAKVCGWGTRGPLSPIPMWSPLPTWYLQHTIFRVVRLLMCVHQTPQALTPQREPCRNPITFYDLCQGHTVSLLHSSGQSQRHNQVQGKGERLQLFKRCSKVLGEYLGFRNIVVTIFGKYSLPP